MSHLTLNGLWKRQISVPFIGLHNDGHPGTSHHIMMECHIIFSRHNIDCLFDSISDTYSAVCLCLEAIRYIETLSLVLKCKIYFENIDKDHDSFVVLCL